MNTDAPNEDPALCECEGWCYSDPTANTWALVDMGEGRFVVLGHHPSCRFWVKPPHESATGLAMLSHARVAEAAIALSRAYQDLVRAGRPPRPDADEDSA